MKRLTEKERLEAAEAFVEKLIEVGQFFISCIEIEQYGKVRADGTELKKEAEQIIENARMAELADAQDLKS